MRQRLRAYRLDALILAALFILPLLLTWQVTLGPKTMVPADNLFQWAPWASAAEALGATRPQNPLIGDLLIQNLAWKQFTRDSLAGGEIPLWNPYLFAGAPFLANGQHSALYPFSALFLVLPLEKAYGWFTVSQLWLAGVAMYAFARVLRMRRSGAAMAGLVYQGGGFIVTSAAVFPMIVAAVVWLPLVLSAIEKIIAGPARSRLLWLALGVVALGLQALAGHAEFTYYTLLVAGLFAAWRLAAVAWERRRVGTFGWAADLLRPSLWLLSMVALGLALAAVQLVPLFEVGQVNFRVGSAAYEEVLGWAYTWREALTLLLPHFYGSSAHHAFLDVFSGATVPLELNAAGVLNPHGPHSSSWGLKNSVEGATYLGIVPLLMAAVAGLALLDWRRLASARRSHALFFLLLAILSVAFIFGTPLYALLYYGLPFIDQLHTPFRWVWPLALAVAGLAGFGVDELKRFGRTGSSEIDGAGSRRTGLACRVVGWAAAGGGVVVLAGLLASRVAYGTARPLVERLFFGLAQAVDAFPDADAFYSYQFPGLAVLGLMLLAGGVLILWPRKGRGWTVVLLLVTGLDLFLAGRGFSAAVDPALLAYRPEAIAWLQAQEGGWRLTTFDPGGTKVLNANTPWLNRLHDVRGYDSIIPRQYTDYMAAIEPQNGLSFNRVQPIGALESLNSPLLDVLGVKYIASVEPLELPKLRLAWEGEGLRIYENLAVAPRAYALPRTATVVTGDPLATLQANDPRRFVVVTPGASAGWNGGDAVGAELVPASIDAASNNEVIATVSVAEPSWLVLNDSYFPGWRAYVRPAGAGEELERETDIHLVNGNFRGVVLEPGEWTVRYRYSPRSFQLGGLVSFMAGIILLFSLVVWGWGRFSERGVTAATGGDATGGTAAVTRSLAKNSAAPMALNLFNKAIDFVFAAFYLRVLGPADAGSYAIAIAAAGIFEIVANFGLNILLIREVSQDRARAGHFLLNSSVLRVITAAIATLPVALYVWSTANSANPLSTAEIAAIALIMVGMVFSGLTLGVSGLFYVYEQAEVPAAMATVTTILKVAFGVAVLLLGFSFVGLAAVSILVNIITLTILTVMAFRRFDLGGPWTLDFGEQRSMLRLGFPLMLIHLLQTIFISIDVLLLRQLDPGGETVVGWYNSAYKWFNALQIIPSFFTLALFPVISRAIKEDAPAARRMYHLSLKVMLLLALPTAALITFAAPLMIGLLGGREFLPQGAIALQIIIWSVPFGWMNSVTNYVLIAYGLERKQPIAFVLAVGFNIIANWLLIPRFSYVASSVITVLSEVVLLVVFNYFLSRREANPPWLHFIARPLALTAFMLAVMWPLSRIGGLVGVALALVAGVAVYVAGLGLLGILGQDERRALAAVLPGALVRRLGWAAT
jgi:O-antigen/teichoic acid export membrane protein